MREAPPDRGVRGVLPPALDNNEHFTTEWSKIVPGQNDTFAPVVPRVPGQFSRCPCGVGAYGKDHFSPIGYIILTSPLRVVSVSLVL